MKAKPKRKPGWDYTQVVNTGKIAQLEGRLDKADKTINLLQEMGAEQEKRIKNLEMSRLEELKSALNDAIKVNQSKEFCDRHNQLVRAPNPFVSNAHYWVKRPTDTAWLLYQATGMGTRLVRQGYQDIMPGEKGAVIHLIPEPKE